MVCKLLKFFSHFLVCSCIIWMDDSILRTKFSARFFFSIITERAFRSVTVSTLPPGCSGKQSSRYLHSSSSFDKFSDSKCMIFASSRRFFSTVVSRLSKMHSSESLFRLLRPLGSSAFATPKTLVPCDPRLRYRLDSDRSGSDCSGVLVSPGWLIWLLGLSELFGLAFGFLSLSLIVQKLGTWNWISISLGEFRIYFMKTIWKSIFLRSRPFYLQKKCVLNSKST